MTRLAVAAKEEVSAQVEVSVTAQERLLERARIRGKQGTKTS